MPLPSDGDLRLPRPSIRTFLNVSHPDRHTVKLPLSVLNTLVWRSLPDGTHARGARRHRLDARPERCRPLSGHLRGDPARRGRLGDREPPRVRRPPEVPYHYKELLGAIWREPVSRHLAPGERARTLAALLHTDPDGRAFARGARRPLRASPPTSGCAASSPRSCRRCCTSSIGTARCSAPMERTRSSSSTTTTSPSASR